MGREGSILLGQSCVSPSRRMGGKAFQSVSLRVLPGRQRSCLWRQETARQCTEITIDTSCCAESQVSLLWSSRLTLVG